MVVIRGIGDPHELSRTDSHILVWPISFEGVPVVMVKEKGGGLCICIDFWQFNAATIKDAQPLLHINDLLNALHGAHWFTLLDIKSGNWQVPIREGDRHTTAFQTING